MPQAAHCLTTQSQKHETRQRQCSVKCDVPAVHCCWVPSTAGTERRRQLEWTQREILKLAHPSPTRDEPLQREVLSQEGWGGLRTPHVFVEPRPPPEDSSGKCWTRAATKVSRGSRRTIMTMFNGPRALVTIQGQRLHVRLYSQLTHHFVYLCLIFSPTGLRVSADT